MASTAAAQTPSPFAYWQNSAGIVLAPLGGPIPEWRANVGGGAALLPRYEGSDRYRVVPAPALDIRYRDIAFLSTGDGLGVDLLRGTTYRGGIAVAYDLGRSQKATGRLNGIGDVEPSPEFRLFLEGALLPFVFSVDIRRAFWGHGGLIGDLGVYMPVVGTEELVVFLGPTVTLANSRYMQAYFGIGTAQAAPHSIFPFYRAEGGIKNVNFGATAIYHFTPNWFVDAGAGFERLLDAAADSPIVQVQVQFGVSLVLGYEF